MLSIPEEAARLWVAGCSEQERGWVPRRELESVLDLMWEVERLRLLLAFGRAHAASLTLSENEAVATRGVGGGVWRAAASKVVMRSGRHFVRFTVLDGDDMLFGAIRPDWDVEEGQFAWDADGHCFYSTADRRRCPSGYNWEGIQVRRWATASACCSTSTRAA